MTRSTPRQKNIGTLKDYYYLLGIRRKADLKEIQQAFRKLAIKFHPEDRDSDPFYNNYYRRIKEAYDQLSDEQRRYTYDRRLARFEAASNNKQATPSPVINSFFASKKESKVDELITISWEVLNAEAVKITPIGEVASNGTQTIRLPEMRQDQEYILLELQATNADESNSVSKTLSIKNLSFVRSEAADTDTTYLRPRKKTQPKKERPIPSFEEEPAVVTIPKKQKTPKAIPKKVKTKPKKVTTKRTQSNTPNPRQQNQTVAYIIVAGMVFIMIIMSYVIYSLNPVL